MRAKKREKGIETDRRTERQTDRGWLTFILPVWSQRQSAARGTEKDRKKGRRHEKSQPLKTCQRREGSRRRVCLKL